MESPPGNKNPRVNYMLLFQRINLWEKFKPWLDQIIKAGINTIEENTPPHTLIIHESFGLEGHPGNERRLSGADR